VRCRNPVTRKNHREEDGAEDGGGLDRDELDRFVMTGDTVSSSCAPKLSNHCVGAFADAGGTIAFPEVQANERMSKCIVTPLIAACLIAAAAALAHADTPSVDFDGQRYRLEDQPESRRPNGGSGSGPAEFTLEGETVDNWTKLFAFHVYPWAGNDPSLAAATLGQVVQNENPDANFALQEDKKNGEAIIDFLTWRPGSDLMEFNVFKYARAEYGPGLIALQFAQRFKLGDLSVEEFRALRDRAVKAMGATDVAPARDYFAAKARERLGAVRSGAEGLGQGAPARATGDR
jgi:hypothetical protein